MEGSRHKRRLCVDNLVCPMIYGGVTLVKIHQAVYLRDMTISAYIAYFKKTFTKNEAGFSQEVISEQQEEVGEGRVLPYSIQLLLFRR